MGERLAQGYDNTKIEVHVIAYVYHWGRNEILKLPINVRKEYVDLINQQKQAENDANSQ